MSGEVGPDGFDVGKVAAAGGIGGKAGAHKPHLAAAALKGSLRHFGMGL